MSFSRKMSSSGWMGRLKLAARAIDLRLKAAACPKTGLLLRNLI